MRSSATGDDERGGSLETDVKSESASADEVTLDLFD